VGWELCREHCLTGQLSRIPCLHNGTERKTVSEDPRGHKVVKVPRTVGFKLGLHFYTDFGFGRRGGLMVRWGDVTDENDSVVQRSKR
jgi:hypothetical protein